MKNLNYPKHIAIIPDGNRTWAKWKWFEPFIWHLEWFNRIVELWKYIFEQTPIKVYTAWWLSTENLKNRSKQELNYLFELYKKVSTDMFDVLKNNKINFRVAWNIKQLPEHLQLFLNEKIKELSFDSDRYMFLALNYGGQDEILRAIKKTEQNNEELSKENIEKNMDFGCVPPVELVIRTKQKLAQRLSGFMLWWIGYAQLYFTEIFFPDFNVEELKKALAWYSSTVKTQNFWK